VYFKVADGNDIMETSDEPGALAWRYQAGLWMDEPVEEEDEEEEDLSVRVTGSVLAAATVGLLAF
jgi:hypothetical protein